MEDIDELIGPLVDSDDDNKEFKVVSNFKSIVVNNELNNMKKMNIEKTKENV